MATRQQPWDDAVAGAPWAKLIPPAPGNLRFVQAFVNTTDLGRAPDELASPAALAAWLARWRLMPEGIELSPADLRRTVEAREDMRSLLRSVVGKPLAPEVVTRLDQAARSAVLRVRFERRGVARDGARWPGAEDAALTRASEPAHGSRANRAWNRGSARSGSRSLSCSIQSRRPRPDAANFSSAVRARSDSPMGA